MRSWKERGEMHPGRDRGQAARGRWHAGGVVLLWSVLCVVSGVWGATFELHNRDVVNGDVSILLTLAPALGGQWSVPIEDLVSLDEGRMTFADGMVVRGQLQDEKLVITTLIGKVEVPGVQIKTVKTGKTMVRPTSGTIVTLSSGEVIVGERPESLVLALEVGGTLQVSPEEVVEFDGERFTFQDGTVLKGQILDEALRIRTRYGELLLPREEVQAIAVAGGLRPPGERAAGKEPEPVQVGQPAPGEKTWVNSIGMAFILIPEGQFMMGSKLEARDERPVHDVRLSRPFYLGRYEVTQGQWRAIMGRMPSHFKGDANLPLESVSWEDIQEFIRRLNTQEGDMYYRLPTEAEWEYAARAGSTTVYSFGNSARDLREYAWYEENTGGKTHVVGQRKPNAWGLYDMHGNVWEWVHDWYSVPYPSDAVTDPQGPPSGTNRVSRGGGWNSGAGLCRSSLRYEVSPGSRYNDLGFRLVRVAP